MEGDLLGEWQNWEQEEAELLRKEIFIESKPSLKNEPNANPNTAIRLVRKIYESHCELYKSVYNILIYLKNYKQTLALNNFLKDYYKKYVANNVNPQQLSAMVASSREEIVNSIWQAMVERKEDISQQEMSQVQKILAQRPLMRLFKVNLMRAESEVQSIRNCSSKLKVMVLKAMYRQSTNLEYLIECYTTNLKSALNSHMLKYRDEKSQKYRLLDIQFARHQFIYLALTALKNRLYVISIDQLRDSKIAPYSYLALLSKGYLNQHPLLFVNFYTEPLLFIDHQYTQFDTSLLYCPVVARGATISLSNFYLGQLNSSCQKWSQQQLLIELYHCQTSTTLPIYYSYISESIDRQNNRFSYEKTVQQCGGGRHFRHKKQIDNFNKMMGTILKIRKYVFVKLLYHWLSKIHNISNQKPIEIDILGKFKAVIKIVTEPVLYEVEKRQPELRLDIMSNLLILAATKSNVECSRQHLKEKIYANLQGSLLRLVTQKTGYKVSWPMEAGSMGHYYYDYSKDRVVARREVKQFLNTF